MKAVKYAIGGVALLGLLRIILFASKWQLQENRTASAKDSRTLHSSEADTRERPTSAAQELDVTAPIVSHNARNRVIFYNRIAKCGSRSLWNVTQILSSSNKFDIKESRKYFNLHPSRKNILEEVEKIAAMEPPAIYNRHIHYIDFQSYGYTPPVYINMIREPIQRFVSHYNFVKYGDHRKRSPYLIRKLPDINECVAQETRFCNRNYTSFMFYMGMYFCGQEEVCKSPSRARVELAKKHIDEEYSVIGATEEFENTLLLLERILPGYFHGAHSAWVTGEQIMKEVSKTTKRDPELTKEAEFKLKNDLMKDEYEVYYHAIGKFERLKKEHGIF